ncbi:MAG: DEAD/DEAH box helicase [Tepidisphaeraceae bacterium]
MRALQAIQSDFSRKTRERGEDYYRRGMVKIIDSQPNRVLARVQGTQLYDVNVGWSGSEYSYFCTCPRYEEHNELCKHVWATLLAAESRGVLPGAEDFRDETEEEEEEFTPEIRPMKLGNRKVDFVHFRERPRPEQEPQRHAVWRRRLTELRSDWRWKETAPPAPWPAGKQIVYAILVDGQSQNEGLCIELYSRPAGKPGALKRLRMQMNQVHLLPEAADRELIGTLVGLAASGNYGYQDLAIPNRLWLRSPRDSAAIMRKMCQTGRCVLHEGEENRFKALQWDEGEPWRLHLAVSPDEKGTAYRLGGVLKRGQERRDVTEAGLIVHGSLLILADKMSGFEDNGAFRFVHLLRSEPNLTVPGEQGDQLLEELFEFSSVPPLELPESMQVAEARPAPRPRLTLSAPNGARGRPGDDRLCCKLAFDYAEQTFLHGEKGSAKFDAKLRRILYRDLAAEQAAAELLSELGFRADNEWEAKAHDFRLLPRRLPAAVRELTGRQWHVEVSGKVYRQPGKIQIQVSSGIDWFELNGQAEFEGVSVKVPKLLQAIRKGETTVVLDDGTIGILPEEWLKRYGLLAAVAEVKDEVIQFTKNQAGLLDALLAGLGETRVDETFARAREELRRFEGVQPVDPAPTFNGLLRPYQREGLGWLNFLRTFGLNGCLADDMGLGKTVQVLALLEDRRALREKAREDGQEPMGPSLVVVPRSLVFNWQQEAAKFAPQLRVLDHATADRLRTVEHFQDFDVILTTYGTLRNDVTQWSDVRFDYAILDEAQSIKNAASESAKAARLLRADHRLALSGTPVQNHLGELWSLLEFLNPGMLGRSSAFSTMTANADRAASVETRQFLAGALRPFILRRTKEQVAADLPEKFEQTIFCELDKPQRALYDELKEHYRQSLLGRIEQEGLGKSKLQVLEALLRLRQAACHPGLLNKSRIDDASAKLDTLVPRLAEVAEEGHKTIVFSQFTSFLAILRKKLDEQGGVYEYLDGKTRDRQERVNRFQTDDKCKLFLVSLKAGGLGLNLTAAQYVFLLDPWWNPAVEAQAIDRAHRIGQTQQVFAYRLIAKDTVEEKVLQLQQGKRELADAIINADNALIGKLGREELELLLS